MRRFVCVVGFLGLAAPAMAQLSAPVETETPNYYQPNWAQKCYEVPMLDATGTLVKMQVRCYRRDTL